MISTYMLDISPSGLMLGKPLSLTAVTVPSLSEIAECDAITVGRIPGQRIDCGERQSLGLVDTFVDQDLIGFKKVGDEDVEISIPVEIAKARAPTVGRPGRRGGGSGEGAPPSLNEKQSSLRLSTPTFTAS